VSTEREDLRDAVAHEPGTDDADTCLLSQSPYPAV
jgi:hypothetical protein